MVAHGSLGTSRTPVLFLNGHQALTTPPCQQSIEAQDMAERQVTRIQPEPLTMRLVVAGAASFITLLLLTGLGMSGWFLNQLNTQVTAMRSELNETQKKLENVTAQRDALVQWQQA